jgi:hypothetical protein
VALSADGNHIVAISGGEFNLWQLALLPGAPDT